MAGLITCIVGCTTTPSRHAGINQFVENRDGRQSVWGVEITLDKLSFTPAIGSDQIQITSAKQGRDLKELLTWSVSADRKCLQIRFKPGMGYFGTGNAITVALDRSAIVGYKGVNNRFEWSIQTDVQ